VNPRFLSVDVILHFHRRQIDTYGGSHGVRDIGLLESALAQPEATFGGEYLHSDVHEMAAAYFYHLAANHPFLDGNKRIAAVACMVFLRANGISIRTTNEELYEFTVGIASGQVEKPEIADWLRARTRP
jgi:death-on-curing protein